MPVGERDRTRWADLAIAYDRSRATVHWLDGTRERFRITNPGQRIDRRWMVVDKTAARLGRFRG